MGSTVLPRPVALKDPHVLLLQSGYHKSASDHGYSVVGGHQPLHEAFIVTSTPTMPTMGTAYTGWWETISPHLVTHAEAHRVLGNHLAEVVEAHEKIDTHGAFVFSGGQSPKPSI